MRSKDPNNITSRDILRKIEENILIEFKKKVLNQEAIKNLNTELSTIQKYLDKNEKNYKTTFKEIEKTEGLLTKW